MRKYEVTWTEITRYRTVVMANDSVEAAEVAMREGDLETLSQDSDHFEVQPVKQSWDEQEHHRQEAEHREAFGFFGER